MKAAGNKRRPRRSSHRPDRGPLVRGRAKLAILVGLLLVPFAVHIGCSDKNKHDVLSFFFDGVPSPDGNSDEGADERPRTGKRQSGRRSRTPEGPEATRIVSRHAPYRDRKCFQCHGVDASLEIAAASGPMCGKCHKEYGNPEPTDWSHGPTAAGDCSFCHKSHESPNKALLTAPQPGLCLRCHDADVLNRTYHATADKQTCSTCHDPHYSGNRLLLADGRTYERRKTAEDSGSTHLPWKDAKCGKCHVISEGNRVVDNINSVCMECHQKAAAPLGKRLHAPVRQGQCVLCHLPHSSPKPNLRRPDVGKVCLTCHEAEDVNVADHPRFTRVDCLLCHAGHSSRREHLLKPGIPSAREPDGGVREPRTVPRAGGRHTAWGHEER